MSDQLGRIAARFPNTFCTTKRAHWFSVRHRPCDHAGMACDIAFFLAFDDESAATRDS